MMHRHRMDRRIARMELQLQLRYAQTTDHAGLLCRRLLGPRCKPTARWVAVAVLVLLTMRRWRLWRC
jgi:hypothetical protein